MATTSVGTELRIDVPSRIGAACAKEAHRYAMRGVEYRPGVKDGECWLSATDGHILGVVKASANEPAGTQLIPAEIMPNKLAGGTIERQNGQWQCGNKFANADDEAGSFPPVGDVIPDIDADGKYETAIAIDAGLLFRLAKAIGYEPNGETGTALVLFIDSPKKAIAVRGANGRIGVIMPMSTSDGHRGDYSATRAEYLKALEGGAA